MPRIPKLTITIKHREYVNDAVKITEDVYELPEFIYCSNDNCKDDDNRPSRMHYYPNENGIYFCPCCGSKIKVRDYLKEQLREKAELNEYDLEAAKIDI